MSTYCPNRSIDGQCELKGKPCDDCAGEPKMTFQGVVFVDDIPYKPEDIRNMRNNLAFIKGYCEGILLKAQEEENEDAKILSGLIQGLFHEILTIIGG